MTRLYLLINIVSLPSEYTRLIHSSRAGPNSERGATALYLLDPTALLLRDIPGTKNTDMKQTRGATLGVTLVGCRVKFARAASYRKRTYTRRTRACTQTASNYIRGAALGRVRKVKRGESRMCSAPAAIHACEGARRGEEASETKTTRYRRSRDG